MNITCAHSSSDQAVHNLPFPSSTTTAECKSFTTNVYVRRCFSNENLEFLEDSAAICFWGYLIWNLQSNLKITIYRIYSKCTYKRPTNNSNRIFQKYGILSKTMSSIHTFITASPHYWHTVNTTVLKNQTWLRWHQPRISVPKKLQPSLH